jgi:hypothetical protein
VPPSPDTARRLAHLEQILAETTSGTTSVSSSDTDATDVHLSSVPTERIRRLTRELQRDLPGALDEIDVVILTLLLNEYSSAVGHLRAVVRMAAATVDNAAGPVREAKRLAHRYGKMTESAAVRDGIDTVHK